MASKGKRFGLIGHIADQEILLEALRDLSTITWGDAAPLPSSEQVFSLECTCPPTREAAFFDALNKLPCAYGPLSDDAGGKLFGKRKAEDTPAIRHLDKVTARIIAVAENEARTLEEANDKAVAEITARYDEAAQNAYWQRAAAGKLAADRKAQGLSDMAILESKKQVLAFKQSLVAETFSLAAERLCDLSEERYIKFLVSLCLRGAQTGEEQLIFSPRDRRQIGKRVTIAANEALESAGRTGRLTMSGESRDIKGGLILTDGWVDVNCSIEALITTQKRDLIKAVSELLFD